MPPRTEKVCFGCGEPMFRRVRAATWHKGRADERILCVHCDRQGIVMNAAGELCRRGSITTAGPASPVPLGKSVRYEYPIRPYDAPNLYAKHWKRRKR